MLLLLILNLFCVQSGSVLDQIPKFETREEASQWVHDNIDASSTNDFDKWGVEEYWQTPEETLMLKTADCDDFAILMMYILKIQFYDNPSYAVIKLDNGIHHAIVINDKYIQNNNYIYDYIKYHATSQEYLRDIISVYDYNSIMFTAYLYHKPISINYFQ